MNWKNINIELPKDSTEEVILVFTRYCETKLAWFSEECFHDVFTNENITSEVLDWSKFKLPVQEKYAELRNVKVSIHSERTLLEIVKVLQKKREDVSNIIVKPFILGEKCFIYYDFEDKKWSISNKKEEKEVDIYIWNLLRIINSYDGKGKRI